MEKESQDGQELRESKKKGRKENASIPNLGRDTVLLPRLNFKLFQMIRLYMFIRTGNRRTGRRKINHMHALY